MERRKFVIGLGSLAAGSAAAMGTGAVTSFTGDRNASIPVVNDTNAFIALQATGSDNSQYFDPGTGPGEKTEFVFGDDVIGEGFNRGTTFIDRLFRIVNQSSQTQYVWLQENANNGGDKATAFYVGSGPSDGTKPDYAISYGNGGQKPRDFLPQKDDNVDTQAVKLTPGEGENIGFVVKTNKLGNGNQNFGSGPTDLLSSVTVNSVADPADLPSTWNNLKP